ncbi:hypothetical protein [Sphingomonas gellani]|nr:hypothetical protein [Sphingomonas gellani]
METSFDLLLWRGTLADAPPVPTARDLAEWAEVLADAGEDAGAALLSDVAALHDGFSPQMIASRTGSACARPAGYPSRPDGASLDWTLHLGLSELSELARRAAAAGRPRLARPLLLPLSCRADNIGTGALVPGAIGDIAVTARTLRTALESEIGAEGRSSDKLATLLASLVEADRRYPALDYRAFAQASLTLLVPAIAMIGLLDFALSTRDLWSGPLGSPSLFHHVARQDSAGLGPYLGNVGRLARNSHDVVDLARIACRAAAEGGDGDAALEAWIALLSRGCRREMLYEIVDDLGDQAAHGPLLAILDRTASRPAAAIDTDLVRRVRDVGLDNGDYALAAHAQQVIVRLAPDNRLEGVILGSIEASGGEFGRAEAIFRHWLARTPDDLDLRERLLDVTRDRFDRFAIPHGYGSPADRRDTRLNRRGVSPDYPRRSAERIRAVDVG